MEFAQKVHFREENSPAASVRNQKDDLLIMNPLLFQLKYPNSLGTYLGCSLVTHFVATHNTGQANTWVATLKSTL